MIYFKIQGVTARSTAILKFKKKKKDAPAGRRKLFETENLRIFSLIGSEIVFNDFKRLA